MEYCSKCLYPNNHPLNITFNQEKICSGCLVHYEKDQLNWDTRFKKLKKLLIIINLKIKKNLTVLFLFQVEEIVISSFMLLKNCSN